MTQQPGPWTPPPGWYPDPQAVGQQRYWDGGAWTEHRAPVATAYAGGYSGPSYPGTSGLAVASMVLGILWIFWIGAILALIFGYIALRQIKRTPGLGGKGMAIAGIVLGWVWIALLILGLIFGDVHVHGEFGNTPNGSTGVNV
jgi:hypothetical protein